jgi:tetratricopeptide (TPR) repeat protein
VSGEWNVVQKLAKESFDEANHLWFYEGYTSRAIEKYKEALQLSGEDPVIAFQLASALCDLGRKDDALNCVAILDRRRQLLGEEGRRQLDALKHRCGTESPGPIKHSPQDRALDVEQLERQKLSSQDWRRLAPSAESMGLYGVALRAYEQCDRGFLDLDVLHDEEDVRFKIEQHLGLLEDMRKEMAP